jgi:hypothetical protein
LLTDARSWKRSVASSLSAALALLGLDRAERAASVGTSLLGVIFGSNSGNLLYKPVAIMTTCSRDCCQLKLSVSSVLSYFEMDLSVNNTCSVELQKKKKKKKKPPSTL